MKSVALAIIILMGLGAAGGFALAHGTTTTTDDHTAIEEAEGKALWEKLQAKELTCANLDEEDFGALGEYFMGQMLAPYQSRAFGSGAGASHESMNNIMTMMMSEKGEVEMHAAMGRRLSGCDSAASFSRSFPYNFMFNPMMWNWGQNMMGWGGLGWIFTLTWLVWLAVGVLLVIWLWQKITKK